MARAPFMPTDAIRDKVRYLSGLGIPHDNIAKIIDCSAKTLRKHFRRELDRGAAESLAVVSGHLFAAAKRGNVTAQIFIMKCRGGWKERTVQEVSGPDGGPVESVKTVIYLPDNGRGPKPTEGVKRTRERLP